MFNLALFPPLSGKKSFLIWIPDLETFSLWRTPRFATSFEQLLGSHFLHTSSLWGAQYCRAPAPQTQNPSGSSFPDLLRGLSQAAPRFRWLYTAPLSSALWCFRQTFLDIKKHVLVIQLLAQGQVQRNNTAFVMKIEPDGNAANTEGKFKCKTLTPNKWTALRLGFILEAPWAGSHGYKILLNTQKSK